MSKQKLKKQPFDIAIADQISKVLEFEDINKEEKNNSTVTPSGQDSNKTGTKQGHLRDISVTEQGQIDNSTVTPSGQDSNKTGIKQGHLRDSEITGKGQQNNSKITGKGQDDNRTVTVTGHHQRSIHIVPDNCVQLTSLQVKIYNWFLSNGVTGYYNKVKIEKDTGITHNTIRKTIAKFIKLDLIFFGEYNNGIKLTPYKINNEKKVLETSVTGQGQDNNSNGTSVSYSSSSLIKNTTTNKKFTDEATILEILNHPELKFWKDQGVTVKQILNGLKTTEVTLDVFIQSMKHFAHENPKSTRPPMAHLVGGIKLHGIWAKKSDYKSYEQKKAEIEAQIIADQAEEIKRLKAIREAKIKITKDLEFEKFMADQDSVLFKEIFNSLSDFEQKRVKMGKDESIRRAWENKL